MHLLYCYAADDNAHRERLNKHLSMLVDGGQLATWDAQLIEPGLPIAAQLETWIKTADALLVLISADFFASSSCRQLLARAHEWGLPTIPVLIRPVNVEASEFANIQFLPAGNRAVSLFADPDEAWTEVSKAIQSLVRSRATGPRLPFLAWDIRRESRDFSGREAALARLGDLFLAASREGVGHVQVISGLGGMGKTQLARAYAHRFRSRYQAGFSIDASSKVSLHRDLALIAARVGLSAEPRSAADAAMRWLAEQPGWLLLLNSADDLELVRSLCAAVGRGHILVTTRADSDGGLGNAPVLRLDTWTAAEAVSFLRRRCNRPEGEQDGLEELARELDYLPLALEQAGAHLDRLRTPVDKYLRSLRKRRLQLLQERPAQDDYPFSVATTWAMNLDEVRRVAPAAAALLECAAFLSPVAIPEELFAEGAAALGPPLNTALAGAVEDPLLLDEVLGPLLRYSLLSRDPVRRTLSLNRLVQEVIRGGLDEPAQRVWAERLVSALAPVFAKVEYGTQERCNQFITHATACAALIARWQLRSEQAGHLLKGVGYFLIEQAQHREAEPVLRQAREVFETILGAEHPEVGDVLNKLGWLHHSAGRYAEAEPLYRQALRLCTGLADAEALAVVLTNLALLCGDRGLFAEAEELHLRSLSLREGQPGADCAQSLNNLGLLLADQGRYAEAEAYYNRALSARRELLGEVHPLIAVVLNNLAGLHLAQRRFDQAEPLYLLALAIREKTLRAGHTGIANSLSSLAVLYQHQGRHQEAGPLLLRALELREKALGPEHPAVAHSLNNLAVHYQYVKQDAEAQPLLHRALAISERAYGPDHPAVAQSLTNLAGSHRRHGELAAAEELLRRALRIQERCLRPDHGELLTTLDRLAAVCGLLGKAEDAQQLEERRQAALAVVSG